MLVSRRTTLSLRAVALLYLALLLLLPVAVVLARTFEHGLGTAWGWVTTPAAISALWLSIVIAAIAVPANTIFGVAVWSGNAMGAFVASSALAASGWLAVCAISVLAACAALAVQHARHH